MAVSTWVGNYYVKASGAMAVSRTTPDGYIVDANGVKIVSNNIAELSDGSTHTGNYVISTLAVFGPAAGKTTTINGNVTINYSKGLVADSISMQNLVINGKLTVNFGAGNLVLDNVKVTGVDISDVGSQSLHIRGNSSIGTLTVNDKNNDAHIVIEGNASIANITIFTGANLEVASGATNAKAFENVTISPVEVPSTTNIVTLTCIFSNVDVTRPSNVNVAEGSILKSIAINSD